MRRSIPIATVLFLAACGGGSDNTVVLSDPAPKTTRMACTDWERKTPTGWVGVTIDPAEFPWRSMEVTSQYGPYFVSDPQGDIVNSRGIDAPLPPGSESQPTYAQVYRVGSDAILVWISSAPRVQSDLFKFRTDGTMIELGQTPDGSPGAICTPAELGR